MLFLLVLLCVSCPLFSAIPCYEQYAGELPQHNAAIAKALEFMPAHSPIRAELEQRRAQVAQIWDTTKTLHGETWRVISILYHQGYGMYETRRYKKAINRRWYSRILRVFRPHSATSFEALS